MLTGVNAGNEFVTISKSFWIAPGFDEATRTIREWKVERL